LNLEFSANQGVQLHTRDNHIAPRGARLSLWQLQFTSEFIEDFHREECDLAFVVLFEVEEPVAADAATRDARDLVHLDHGISTDQLPVVAKEVVACGDE
jgi:hypothetical protein